MDFNKSYDGTLLWKIDNMNKKMLDSIKGKVKCLTSTPFFTSVHWYRMYARVYLNGDGMGKNKYMSVFIGIMKGQYDAILKWPLKGKITVGLINQADQSYNYEDAFLCDKVS